ncbi:MAG TPA: hypothetical protein VNT26_01625 [Candidatus Sulfotelmatobacter sp.]|nr:hypothetical protein [Candidatus Sulfotelmatobacter sp.]HWI58009.1 hypothetical protein [Bacillota bacterium]
MKRETNWKARFLAVGCLLAAVTPSWARLPPPIQARGIVVKVDWTTHTVIFQPESSKQPLVLDWNASTTFARENVPVSAGALLPGSRVTACYKPVSFHHPLLKQAIIQPAGPRIAKGY